MSDIVLQAQGLTKRFHEGRLDVTVLTGVDLTVRAGETVAIVGPSGCGKTTLIKMLVGLVAPTEGAVLVNGRNLKDWDMSRYRRRIGAALPRTHDALR